MPTPTFTEAFPTLRTPFGQAERGSGVVGLSAGCLVFLLLMFFAVQLLFNLYATSMVVSEAHRAAHTVASFRGGPDRCLRSAPVAERAFRNALGAYGSAGHAQLRWNCTDPGIVEVTVIADHPSILPSRIGGIQSLTHVERTIQIRVERFQQ